MSTASLRSIDALDDLQTGLIRYADQTLTVLNAIQREIERTLEWLDERVRHWQNQVRRCAQAVDDAQAAYRRCMASGSRDHPPSCGHLEQAVQEARRRLALAQAEERMASQARQAVQAEVEAYQREASRLRALLQNEMPKAVATLRYKATVLRSYTGGVSAGGGMAGALAFGAGMFVGAAIGAAGQGEADSVEAAAQTLLTFPEGAEPPIQQLHPEIRTVSLDQIDLSDSSVQSEADFHKVSHDEMVVGLTKLQQVQRWIAQGVTDQTLRDIDAEQGLSGAQGYHNIYKIFYGDSAIALAKVGDRYEVINGYHRLAVARELGWTTIPARIVE
ncbi:MAG: ParB-like nuclease domain-containing protein [Caldilineaceae bacterium]|nr:ParB-like nuclease domain-containing protein [Caldilineaceae bacterium]